jgi:hypothetical protein
MQLGSEDDYCSINFDSEEEKFEYVLREIEEFGSEILVEYGKPVVVTDFTIMHSDHVGDPMSACWAHPTAGRFMAYLGENANRLAKAGYLGLIYGEWDTDRTSGGIRFIETNNVYYYRGSFFEGMFAAARNFAGHSFTVYYSEAQVGAASTCPCTPCTAADDPALCNGHFQGDLSMPQCEGYQQGMKWPDNCVSEDVCIFPEEGSGLEVSCRATYNNGTTTMISFDMDDIVRSPTAYQDVIGSIDSPEKYCFVVTDEGNAVTYSANDQNSFDSTAAVFSMDGDLEVECDPTESLLEPFCGYLPPVTDYKLECEVLP